LFAADIVVVEFRAAVTAAGDLRFTVIGRMGAYMKEDCRITDTTIKLDTHYRAHSEINMNAVVMKMPLSG
jgi:hypothetical protein